MEDADKQTPLGMKESLQDQFRIVKTLTTMSNVMQYGDLSWTNMTIGQFEGEVTPSSTIGRSAPVEAVGPNSAGVVSSRDITMHSLYYSYLRTPKGDLAASHRAAAALQKEIAHRIEADNLFSSLTQSMVNENWASVFSAQAVTPVVPSLCVDAVHNAIATHCGGFSDYSLQYARVVYNLCAFNQHSASASARMVSTLEFLCTKA